MAAGSSIGNLFKVTTWGESHGEMIGVVVDGVPAGLAISEDDIQHYLNRRKAGTTAFSTKRHESDFVTINSGVFNGMTTGTPISLTITNSAVKERPESETAQIYRPGHADYTYDAKFGIRDYRGGGRASGRETAARVAAGAIAVAILKKLGVTFCSYVSSIGPVSIKYSNCSFEALKSSPVNMPDKDATDEAMKYLNEIAEKGDSAGGVVEVIVTGLPAGVGEPVFDKLDANLAKSVMSIGSVKGVEIGDGFTSAQNTGLENNDSFGFNGSFIKKTNHSGGVLGGISDGAEIILRAAVKPTPSVNATQQSVDINGEPVNVEAKNPHDIIIAPRVAVVVEAMMAITIVDMLFENMCARMDNIEEFYKR